jgi:hypothetical protein
MSLIGFNLEPKVFNGLDFMLISMLHQNMYVSSVASVMCRLFCKVRAEQKFMFKSIERSVAF